jgi:hypothetical protein
LVEDDRIIVQNLPNKQQAHPLSPQYNDASGGEALESQDGLVIKINVKLEKNASCRREQAEYIKE